MQDSDLAGTALRAFAVFVFMLVVIRLLGKRTVGNMTAFDLLVALMLGELLGDVIYGDATPAEAVVAIVVVAAAKYATGWLNYFDHGLNAVLEGLPRPIVRHGEIQRRALRAEMMNDKELLAALRLRGVTDVSEVKLATVETDGEVSVVLEDWARPVTRGERRSATRPTDPDDASG